MSKFTSLHLVTHLLPAGMQGAKEVSKCQPPTSNNSLQLLKKLTTFSKY